MTSIEALQVVDHAVALSKSGIVLCEVVAAWLVALDALEEAGVKLTELDDLRTLYRDISDWDTFRHGLPDPRADLQERIFICNIMVRIGSWQDEPIWKTSSDDQFTFWTRQRRLLQQEYDDRYSD